MLNIFGYTGPINQILGFFGQDPVQFFGEPSLFRPLVIRHRYLEELRAIIQ
ncbi:MAG: hypothetical protein ACLU3U_06185 [Gallintestinimicrobium sp.]